ncbi:MAG: hypothetical protein DMF83_01425 [Acidobacteria bacterium]|nr:MAG: hypothetical protein DMF83_01425 [Acidobacteriota bacterium]
MNQTTTLVFPEPLKQLRSQSREAALLGLSVEQTKPMGVITVRPTTLAARGTIEFRGPTRVLRVMLEAAAEGTGREVRLGAPPSPPVEERSVAALPPASPAPPAAQGPPPLDLQGLLRATPRTIDRREGLPGQRPMILKDALFGDDLVWLRFHLEGGASDRVDRVWWEKGDITTYVQEASGKDLRIVVQIPRAAVSKKTRVSLKVAAGPAYRFALTPSTLTSFFKELFK